MICFANVKLNFGLHVNAKRQDGYHDIESLFVPYHGLRDKLEINLKEEEGFLLPEIEQKYKKNEIAKIELTTNGTRLCIARKGGVEWSLYDDLTIKAYQLLEKEYKIAPVDIVLEKLSPVGAGLGGGSSDAAFTLKSLNQLFSLDLSDTQLCHYASLIGSDCPFFIHNQAMLVGGRGEVLTKIEEEEFAFILEENDTLYFPGTKERYKIELVCINNLNVSTKEAYKNIVPRSSGSCSENELLKTLRQVPANWKNHLVNDFEQYVFSKHPQLKKIKQELYDNGASYVSMSGSGPSIFALYPI